MKRNLFYFTFSLGMLILGSCRKDFNDLGSIKPQTSSSRISLFPVHNANSRDSTVGPIMTQLGATYQNPYLLPNMRQAFLNVYGHLPPCDLPITDVYIKWMPATQAEVDLLIDNDALDVSAYPLDRKVLVEGDYYAQEGKAIGDMPVFYSVVKSNTVLPSVAHTVVAEMFIPSRSLILEQEAFRLANVEDDLDHLFLIKRDSIIQRVRLEPCSDYPVELVRLGCIECDDAIAPERSGQLVSGSVKLENKPACPSKWRPIRRVKVVIRGGFLNLKRDVVYTDDNGSFTSDKNFKSCKFKVCYRNDFGKVVDYKNGWSYFWNFMDEYTVEFPFVASGNLGAIDLFVPHSSIPGAVPTGDWCGGVIHNGLIEHHEMSIAESLPPAYYLKVVLHQGKEGNHAGTLMTSYVAGIISLDTGKKFFQSLGIGLLNSLTLDLLRTYSADVRFGYGWVPESGFYNTDRYAEVVYHEFSHAHTLNKVGGEWYVQFGLAEYNNPGPSPYGNCCSANADIISVGEGYAYHMGHWMANQKWGTCSTTFPEQGNIDALTGVREFTNIDGPYNTSHLNFLENFNPNWAPDAAKWIPKGLIWDLIDPINENGPPIKDNVRVGMFNNKRCYEALSSDVKSMAQYKSKLLSGFSTNMRLLIENDVNQLFLDYGY